MGVETGSDKVLSMVNKGVNREEMIEAGQKAIKAGFKFSCMIISGLGDLNTWRTMRWNLPRLFLQLTPLFFAAEACG